MAQLADSDLSWVPRWLSYPRWKPYLEAAGGNSSLGLLLYEWNLDIAQALMHDIAHIEIALRNHYDTILSQEIKSGDNWVFDPRTPIVAPLLRRRKGKTIDLNAVNRASIAEAKRRSGLAEPTPGQVIAELNFGFWRHMTDSSHEKSLWIPILRKAYPPKTNRSEIDKGIRLINDVRNRASHHEPFISPLRLEQARQAGRQILRLAAMIIPELVDHIQNTSTLKALMDEKPDSSG